MAPPAEPPSRVNLEEIDFDELDDYLELFQQDSVIKDALAQGVDLRGYAAQIDAELRAAEVASVSQYVMKSAEIVELHDEVQTCDNILARMQEMLLGFQADLGGISDEIRHLQDESIGMNVRVKNRKDTEARLHRFLDHVALSPSLIATIDDGEVNESFLHALVQLNAKLRYVSAASVDLTPAIEHGSGEPSPAPSPPPSASAPASTGAAAETIVPSQTAAYRDVEQQLTRLTGRAVARVREYLWAKLNEMKKPKTNVQMMQQNTLLPMKYLAAFLQEHARELDDEFRELYAETMSRTLATVFKSYHAGLLRLHEEVASKTDLIAVEEQSLKGLFSSKVNLSKRNDTFAMGDREKILEASTIAAPPLILHVASEENLKLPYEAVFRNVQQHLMNSATSEYLFLLDFFSASSHEKRTSSGRAELRSRDLFLRVFAKTISLCLENLENYLFTCYDAIALLLMIRLTHAHRLVMQQRRIPCLDSYFDRVTLLLWPRFKTVFDLNLVSIRQAKMKKLGATDLHPHYVIRRYAEFAASVLSLTMHQDDADIGDRRFHGRDDAASGFAAISSAQMHDTGAGDMVVYNLSMMREEVVTLLTRLAEQHATRKERCVFLVNNYDFVLSMLQEKRIRSDDSAKFEELLATQREAFVEEELVTWYGAMILFVRQNEATVLGAHGGSSTGKQAEVNAAEMEKIVRSFAGSWKSGIEKMNGNIMKYFSNFRNGMEILKQVLTQLLLYYTRFIEIAKKCHARSSSPMGTDIVTTQEILYEIKKYSRSF